MTQQELVDAYNSLDAPEQRRVADFITALQQQVRQARPSDESPFPESSDWLNDPFFGMWKDREDMADSTAWVRKLRGHQD